MMDDVLVFSATPAEHWARLGKVLDRITTSGMTLKKKCEFGCSEVKFMGHVVSAAGIKPDPEKVRAIIELNPPCNKREGIRYLADALSRPCSGFDGSTDYNKTETLAVEEYVRAIYLGLS